MSLRAGLRQTKTYRNLIMQDLWFDIARRISDIQVAVAFQEDHELAKENPPAINSASTIHHRLEYSKDVSI